MKANELYAVWAPAGSKWSPWVLPVVFAQINCLEADLQFELPLLQPGWLASLQAGTGLVVDLPGKETIEYGVGLATRGYRPVPVIDGSPAPYLYGLVLLQAPDSPTKRIGQTCLVDMEPLCKAICAGAQPLTELNLSPDAPPAFLLDSMRMGDTSNPSDRLFDNRWKTYPQDFPTAELLLKYGITKIVVVRKHFELSPLEDLAFVLFQWQEKGIVLERASAFGNDAPVPFTAKGPSWIKEKFRVLVASLGLRRRHWGKISSYLKNGLGTSSG